MNSPTVSTLRAISPELPEEAITEHLERLDERYFEQFSPEEIALHIKNLSEISSSSPVRIVASSLPDNLVSCTVLSFDYPSVFSIIAGCFASTGFNIQSGNVFTYSPPAQKQPGRRGQRPLRHRIQPTLRRNRKIVDHFSGYLDTFQSFEDWQKAFHSSLSELIAILERTENDPLSEARKRVNEMVAVRLAHLRRDRSTVLFPVEIQLDNSVPDCTRLRAVSQDTPAFLYALANALSLNGVSIETVAIRTLDKRVEDTIDLADSGGNPITDRRVLDRIQLSVLLTKQFTHFLSGAPDPYNALLRFEHIVRDIAEANEQGRWMELLSEPKVLEDLARLLGASEFLWEDFIRLQYENLLPLLTSERQAERFALPPQKLRSALEKELTAASDYDERIETLNQFKNREIFRIDLDHLLNPAVDFASFSHHLTALAQLVVEHAFDLAFSYLTDRFGSPQTVGGLPARSAVFGLGKMGGKALGYASDIELLFVYSDNGATTGPDSINNAEFFVRLVQEITTRIEAKREGIFTLDLRLRPFGKDGPLACSVENFCRYYGPGGDAHPYERLALVRLRHIAGDRQLGEQIERIRDDYVYSPSSIDFSQIRSLRERQFEEKNRPDQLNAKFSPGALVDLEYDVQILQVTHGIGNPSLRTPELHRSLAELANAGVLTVKESIGLTEAYAFLRRLINGLRMLRGNASDLFLPDADSLEFAHLARRMGYEERQELSPARRLRMDFDSQTAVVRRFVERHFGRESLPGGAIGNAADLVLSESISEETYRGVLQRLGFNDCERAYRNLRSLAGEGDTRDLFSKLAVLATDLLRFRPDPDMALNNWERFAQAIGDPRSHFERLLSQPTHLEILLSIFSVSQFLSDTLIREPEFLDWAIVPENLHKVRDRQSLLDELLQMGEEGKGHDAWIDTLRRFRRREVLRIGTRDVVLRFPIHTVTHDLSVLAEVIIEAALREQLSLLVAEGKVHASAKDDYHKHLSVLAFGKLGGDELNYSSDVDLLVAYEDFTPSHHAKKETSLRETYSLLLERAASDLTTYTPFGFAYRVDFRLRPFGRSSAIAQSIPGILEYYSTNASLWELQALLKLRPIAGNIDLGSRLCRSIHGLLERPFGRTEVTDSISRLRKKALQKYHLGKSLDIKNGPGGIREIEFLIQGLQLTGNEIPSDGSGANSLRAIDHLRGAGVLTLADSDQLRSDYVFFRRVEHYLQLLEDRQTHTLPESPEKIATLAKRVQGVDSSADSFMKSVHERMERVHTRFVSFLEQS